MGDIAARHLVRLADTLGTAEQAGVGDIAWTTAYDACREPRMGDRHIDLRQLCRAQLSTSLLQYGDTRHLSAAPPHDFNLLGIHTLLRGATSIRQA
jgi:hypothetical protein